MTVLDASAVLALVHDEPGAEQVAAALPSARLGTANLAEVLAKLVDVGIDVRGAYRDSDEGSDRGAARVLYAAYAGTLVPP